MDSVSKPSCPSSVTEWPYPSPYVIVLQHNLICTIIMSLILYKCRVSGSTVGMILQEMCEILYLLKLCFINANDYCIWIPLWGGDIPHVQLPLTDGAVFLSLCIRTHIAVNMHTSFLAVPSAPQNVRAVEISERIEDNCVILVTWDPPANTDQSDIDQYIVNVTSRNIRGDTVSSTIHVLHVRDCGDDIHIQVAAMNHFGCVRPYSSEVQSRLLDIPTAATEDGSASTSSKYNKMSV